MQEGGEGRARAHPAPPSRQPSSPFLLHLGPHTCVVPPSLLPSLVLCSSLVSSPDRWHSQPRHSLELFFPVAL